MPSTVAPGDDSPLVGNGGVRRVRSTAAATARAVVVASSCFLAFFDGRQIGVDDALRIAVRAGAAVVEPERLVAEALDDAERVGDEEDGLAAASELGELVEALVREALVADGEHFVDQQQVGIDVNGDGKPQPHVHAGRVGLDRRVDEVLELGELDDLVEALVISRFDRPSMMPLMKTFSRPEISG